MAKHTDSKPADKKKHKSGQAKKMQSLESRVAPLQLGGAFKAALVPEAMEQRYASTAKLEVYRAPEQEFKLVTEIRGEAKVYHEPTETAVYERTATVAEYKPSQYHARTEQSATYEEPTNQKESHVATASAKYDARLKDNYEVVKPKYDGWVKETPSERAPEVELKEESAREQGVEQQLGGRKGLGKFEKVGDGKTGFGDDEPDHGKTHGDDEPNHTKRGTTFGRDQSEKDDGPSRLTRGGATNANDIIRNRMLAGGDKGAAVLRDSSAIVEQKAKLLEAEAGAVHSGPARILTKK